MGQAWKWDLVVQFNGKDFLQSLGTAMGTKMAVAFANVFMAKIELEILRQSNTTVIFWKRFIDEVVSMWDTETIEEFCWRQTAFILQLIKFKAQISETETIFLDTVVYKGDRFLKESMLYVQTYFKPTETQSRSQRPRSFWSATDFSSAWQKGPQGTRLTETFKDVRAQRFF